MIMKVKKRGEEERQTITLTSGGSYDMVIRGRRIIATFLCQRNGFCYFLQRGAVRLSQVPLKGIVVFGEIEEPKENREVLTQPAVGSPEADVQSGASGTPNDSLSGGKEEAC